jgi:hypothetical protein
MAQVAQLLHKHHALTANQASTRTRQGKLCAAFVSQGHTRARHSSLPVMEMSAVLAGLVCWGAQTAALLGVPAALQARNSQVQEAVCVLSVLLASTLLKARQIVLMPLAQKEIFHLQVPPLLVAIA